MLAGTACLPRESDSTSVQCIDETALVNADSVFVSERTGNTVDVAPHVRSVFQTLNGELQWIQVARSSEVTLATTQDEYNLITLY
jgi:hypothetical protein